MDDKKQKLMECLVKLSLRSGFNSFENFVKYKEKRMCSTEYKAVYPEIQVISTTDDKMYAWDEDTTSWKEVE